MGSAAGGGVGCRPPRLWLLTKEREEQFDEGTHAWGYALVAGCAAALAALVVAVPSFAGGGKTTTCDGVLASGTYQKVVVPAARPASPEVPVTIKGGLSVGAGATFVLGDQEHPGDNGTSRAACGPERGLSPDSLRHNQRRRRPDWWRRTSRRAFRYHLEHDRGQRDPRLGQHLGLQRLLAGLLPEYRQRVRELQQQRGCGRGRQRDSGTRSTAT